MPLGQGYYSTGFFKTIMRIVCNLYTKVFKNIHFSWIRKCDKFGAVDNQLIACQVQYALRAYVYTVTLHTSIN